MSAHESPSYSPDEAPGKRKGSLRLTWIFLFGGGLIFFAGLVFYLALAQAQLRQVRQTVEQAEMDHHQTLRVHLQAMVLPGDWNAAQREFIRFGSLMPVHQLILIAPDGSVLAHSAGNQPQEKVALEAYQSALRGEVQVRWHANNQPGELWLFVPTDPFLEIVSPLRDADQAIVAVLVYERDLQAEFSTTIDNQRNFLLGYLLFSLMSMMVAMALYVVFFQRPLDQIYRLSRAVTQGSRHVRATSLPVVELQRIGQAFNQMLERQNSQHKALEDLNRQLEQQVEMRTRQLLSSSMHVRERSRQLAVLNQVIATASSTLDVPTLIDTTLDQTMQILNVYMGSIWLGPHMVSRGLSQKTMGQISLQDHPQRDFIQQNIMVSDWEGGAPDQLSGMKEIMRGLGVRASLMVPIFSAGQMVGHVSIADTQPRIWTPEETALLEIIAYQMGITAERAHTLEAESTQRRLAEALREVTATLTSTLDFDEVLDRILVCLHQVAPHDAADVMLVEGDYVRIVRSRGQPAELVGELRDWKFPLDELPTLSQMLKTQQALVIPDVQKDPHWIELPISDWIRSYAAAPIVQRGEVVGFIGIISVTVNTFQPEIGPILQTFANHAAIAIGNARLYRHTEQRAAETDALYRAMMPLFNPDEDVIALARQIAESVTQEFASAHCSILLLNENRTHLILVAQSGYVQPEMIRLPLEGAGLTVQALKTGSILYAADVSQEPNYVKGAPQTCSELAIPLNARGHLLGVLNLESPEIDAFDDRARELLSAFADRASLGLENARLFAAIRQHAEQMIQLNDLTRTVLQTKNLSVMLTDLSRQVARMLHADGCYVTLWDERSHRTIPYAAYGPNEAIYRDLDINPNDRTLTDSALRLRRTLIVEDIFDTPHLSPHLAKEYPIVSVLALPLIASEQKMGAVLVGFSEKHVFTPEEVALGEQAAGQISLAIAMLQSLEVAQQNAQEAQQHARELQALHTATTSLVSTLDLEKLLEQILEAAMSAIPAAQAATLHLLDLESGRLNIRLSRGPMGAEVQVEQMLNQTDTWFQLLDEQRPLLVRPTEIVSREGFQAAQLVIAPLIQETETVGVLSLVPTNREAFSDSDLHLLVSFASTAAAALQNAQLHSAVRYLAVTDPLTGVYNRRGFYEQAQQVMQMAVLYDRPVSTLMLDIDYFKLVNDQFGHDVGDTILQVIAERFRKVLRDSDIICRYGGEEFAILLPESDLRGAERAARRLFDSLSAPIHTDSGEISITVSIGVAMRGPSFNTLDELLKCADRALYLAKQGGCNQMQIFDGTKPMDGSKPHL